MTQKYLDGLTYKIIGCAIEVHKTLGPGLLERIYESCLLLSYMRLTNKSLGFLINFTVPIMKMGIKRMINTL